MTMPALNLSPAKANRSLPSRHLADLDLAQRREAVAELGEPAFRANQLSHHYFARRETDVSAMTDLPAASRERLAEALFPPSVDIRAPGGVR